MFAITCMFFIKASILLTWVSKMQSLIQNFFSRISKCTIENLFYSFNDKDGKCAMLNQMRAGLRTKELVMNNQCLNRI